LDCAHDREGRSRAESERRKGRRQRGRREQHREPEAIEEAAEGHCGQGVDAHRERIQRRNPRQGNRRRLAEVIGEQRIVDVAGSDERTATQVQPVRMRKACRFRERGLLHLEIPRVRVQAPRDRQCGQGGQGRHQQREEAAAIVAGLRNHDGEDERADCGANLVERLVQPEAPSPAGALRRIREHRVARRHPEGLSRALENDEGGGHLPVPREREQRHREQIECVTGERDRPVAVRPVGETARPQPQGVADQLAATGYDANGER
jgi:hypothetical protein